MATKFGSANISAAKMFYHFICLVLSTKSISSKYHCMHVMKIWTTVHVTMHTTFALQNVNRIYCFIPAKSTTLFRVSKEIFLCHFRRGKRRKEYLYTWIQNGIVEFVVCFRLLFCWCRFWCLISLHFWMFLPQRW